LEGQWLPTDIVIELSDRNWLLEINEPINLVDMVNGSHAPSIRWNLGCHGISFAWFQIGEQKWRKGVMGTTYQVHGEPGKLDGLISRHLETKAY
jgi:hypothetical protein